MTAIQSAQRAERSQSRLGAQRGRIIRFRLARTWGVYVHSSANVGQVHFAHPTSIVIGAGVIIEDGVTIFQNVTLGAVAVGTNQYPTIRRGATIFAGATVIGDIEVGEDATIGAHSVVLHDVKARTTVVGSPARPVSTSNQHL